MTFLYIIAPAIKEYCLDSTTNWNWAVSAVWRPQSKFRSRGSKSALACRRNQPDRLSKLLPALQAAAEFEFRSLRLPI